MLRMGLVHHKHSINVGHLYHHHHRHPGSISYKGEIHGSKGYPQLLKQFHIYFPGVLMDRKVPR